MTPGRCSRAVREGGWMDPGDSHDACYARPAVLSWWELWPMLAWGGYTVYLFWTGRIFYLLQTVYGHLALAGGVVLLAAFAYGWGVRRRHLRAEAKRIAAAREAGRLDEMAPRPTCGVGEGGVGRCVRSLAFLVPLAVGLSLPARGPNSLAAIQWGVGDFAMMAELATQREMEQAEMRRGYGWVTVRGVAQRLQAGREAKVGTMGLVVRKANMPPGRFYLVRFTMACCAACATPVAVPAEWNQPDALADNQWVEAYGRIDAKRKVFVVEDLKRIPEPDHPYM